MKLSDNPCRRDCPDRSATCHIDCKKYADFKARSEAEKASIQKIKTEERRIREAEVARCKKR